MHCSILGGSIMGWMVALFYRDAQCHCRYLTSAVNNGGFAEVPLVMYALTAKCGNHRSGKSKRVMEVKDKTTIFLRRQMHVQEHTKSFPVAGFGHFPWEPAHFAVTSTWGIASASRNWCASPACSTSPQHPARCRTYTAGLGNPLANFTVSVSRSSQ